MVSKERPRNPGGAQSLVEVELGMQVRAVQLALRVQKLMALDEITTSVLMCAERQQRDIESLRLIAAEMEHLFEYCVREITRIDEVIGSREEVFLNSLREVIENSPFTDEARDRVRRKFMGARGLLQLVRRAAQGLPRLASEEVQHLSRQIAEVELGRPALGDMSQETKCLLMGAAAAACLFVPAAASVGIGILVKAVVDCA